MAIPAVVRGSYLNIQVGDGAGPEVFTMLCGLTTKTFSRQKNTNEHFISDCADPEDISDRFLITVGRQGTISGEGRLNRTQFDMVEDFYNSNGGNIRFTVSEPATDNISDGHFAGFFVMTSLEYSGGDASDGNYATASMTFESSGAITWVDAV